MLLSIAMILGNKSTQKPQKIATLLEKANEKLVVSRALMGVPKRQICLFNKHQNKLRNQTLNIKQTKG